MTRKGTSMMRAKSEESNANMMMARRNRGGSAAGLQVQIEENECRIAREC